MTYSLHPQLSADCHLLGRFTECTVLLNRNASLPWFILVPATELVDLLDLPAAQLAAVMEEARRIAHFLKRELDFPRLNFAALGNVVPQMHLHIIGRAPGDACWPAPVWGNLEEGDTYTVDTLARWRGILVRDCELRRE